MRKRQASTTSKPESKQSVAKQIAGFIEKFDPEIRSVIRSCRSALRKRLPTAIEQVYDNYNFLAIGYCTTERTSDCICSLACSAKGVALSFYYGASLADPHGILLGSGNQNRYIRLVSAATLREPAVAALIDAAVANAEPPLPKDGRGKTMVKSVSAQQRPRRTSVATKAKAKPRQPNSATRPAKSATSRRSS
ncbi:MAG: DUF1801 domain-containing protein [Phycisphaerales bacterium]